MKLKREKPAFNAMMQKAWLRSIKKKPKRKPKRKQNRGERKQSKNVRNSKMRPNVLNSAK